MASRWLLTTPHDGVATSRQLHVRARARRHVLTVTPTPGRGGEGVARDVLRALGKRFERPRTPRDPQKLLALADLWLRAHLIETLIICHAERLAPEEWRHLRVLTPPRGQLWLLADPAELNDAHRDVAREVHIWPGAPHRLADAIGPADTPPHWAVGLAEQTPTPRAPDVDYAPFAVACQQPDREALFANFLLGRDHVRWYLHTVSSQPEPRAVNRLLVAVAHGAVDREAAIARVRGGQAQLLLWGIHTAISAHDLRSRLAGRDLSPPDRHAARLLGSYVEPLPSAAAAACLASGRGPGWLARLTHEQLREGRVGSYRVPSALRHILRVLEQDPWRSGPIFHQLGASAIQLQRTLDTIMRRTGLRLNRSVAEADTALSWATVTQLR